MQLTSGQHASVGVTYRTDDDVVQQRKRKINEMRQGERHAYCWLGPERMQDGEPPPQSVVPDDEARNLFRTFVKERDPDKRYETFRKIVGLAWPEGSQGGFCWHPWAEWAARMMCRERYLAILGCSASGKTTVAALWAMVNWLVAPMQTLVMVTSSTLSASRRRVWGQITDMFQNCKFVLPGKLTDNAGMLRSYTGKGLGYTNRAGLWLISVEKNKEKQLLGRIIGAHQERMIFVADEMTELTDVIVDAALNNLGTAPEFQLIGLGNFADKRDPLGKFSEPETGWDSVTVDDIEWKTKLGYCIRFDGTRTPNLDHPTDKWRFLYGRDQLHRHQKVLGEKSGMFWRFCRSFPAPAGHSTEYVTDQELALGYSDSQIVWLEEPIRVIGIDAAWGRRADSCWAALVQWGTARLDDGRNMPLIHLERWAPIRDDATDKVTPVSLQLVRQIAELIQVEGVRPEYVAMDASGGGALLADRLDELLGAKIRRIYFAAQPTVMPLSVDSPTPASEICTSRAVELWELAKRFLLAGQLRGITPEVAEEMRWRAYAAPDRRGRIVLEPKEVMVDDRKVRPHRWDAACTAIGLLRDEFGVLPGGRAAVSGRPLAIQSEPVYSKANRAYRGLALAGARL